MTTFGIIANIMTLVAILITALNAVDIYFEKKEEANRKKRAEFIKKIHAWSENPTDPTLKWW